jgi:hypothetical protein
MLLRTALPLWLDILLALYLLHVLSLIDYTGALASSLMSYHFWIQSTWQQ